MSPDSFPDVHVVDTELLGANGLHSAYLVDGQEPVLVDAGAAPAVDAVASSLADHGVGRADLAAIVPTHVHLDHAGAVGALAERFPNATVFVHERGEPYLTDAEKLGRLAASARRAVGDAIADQYGDPEVVPADRTVPISDGDVVPCGDDRGLHVVHAPGHAPHQVALQDSATSVLFVGDAAGMMLGGALLPTTPAPDFDLAESLETVDRLRALDPSALAYGHFGLHGDATAKLDAYANVLPEWVAAVERALEDPDVDDRKDLLARLGRDWPSPTLARDVEGVLHALDADV